MQLGYMLNFQDQETFIRTSRGTAAQERTIWEWNKEIEWEKWTAAKRSQRNEE